ncbi:MAG: sulfatase-like hydrolase/transferase, partial [Verrucomicrobia bacterium]|nr:sulfatase-like hydrolase/transferase [Verrucomicrobiota bacterium]
LERERVALALGVALLVRCWLYRAELGWIIFNGRAQPASLQPDAVPVWAFVQTWGNDWLLVVGIVLGFLALKTWLRWRLPKLVEAAAVRVLEAVSALAILLVFSLMLRAHFQLLLELETGLTGKYLRLTHETLGTADLFRLLKTQDRLILLAPAVFFAIAYRGAARLRQIYRTCALAFTAVMLAGQLLLPGKQLAPELSQNPAVYLAGDLIRNAIDSFWRSRDEYRNQKLLPGEEQLKSIALVDGAFVDGPPSPPPTAAARTAKGKPWNILLFVMESTGADYVFDRPFGEEMPMPFLRQLAREGLWCPNHFTTCNSSASAAFSILTGLYPPPATEVFAMRRDNRIPIWNAWLRNRYDTFLMHPSSISYSFPVDFLQNNGLTNLYFQERLPIGLHADKTDMARNEIETVRFFERKLNLVHEPFCAIYWSFVPHHPYSDYGEEYRIRADIHPDRNRYYNNLRLLDTQLRLLFRHLESSGLADRTLVILVGDHGEAFGQHPGIWSHSFGATAETFRTPLIFWQPKLIKPQIISRPTSHVDILPTLLDVLGVKWDATRLQGESLLRDSRRKYIFAADATADHILAVSTNLTKVSICLPDDEASAYNLARDPMEKVPLREDRFPTQIADLLKFYNFQPKMIEAYNDALKAGQAYPSK